MTYIISTVNKAPLIDNQDATTGRLIREDNSEINLANWLTDVVTNGSGVELNIDGSDIEVIVEQDQGSIIKTFQNGRVLFSSNFYEGFDTYSRWHLIYNDSTFLPGVVNDERAIDIASAFLRTNDDEEHFVATMWFSDEDGGFWSMMEHSGIFSRLNHIKTSYH